MVLESNTSYSANLGKCWFAHGLTWHMMLDI